jgi:hypothetical protein
MVVVQIGEPIQPQIAEHHRVEVKPDKIAEAEAGIHKEKSDDAKQGADEGGHVKSGRIIEYVKRCGGEVVRKPEIGDVNK